MRAHRIVALAAAAVALVGVATACGEYYAAAEPAAAAANEVLMAKSYRFEPKTIEIAVGETVTWRNDDNFTHTVQVDGQRITRSSRASASRSPSTSPAPSTTSARFTSRTWKGRWSSGSGVRTARGRDTYSP
jgi:plastocyanin